MDWTIKLEARTGWGAVETIEVARLERRVVGLTPEEVGLSLAEAKGILAELQRLVLQTQMEEYTTCARVCPGCLMLRRRRDRRTRTIQTLFGTVTVDAPRIAICPCQNTMGFVDLSISPLAGLLPDRCTPELRRVQAELGARHSFREAGRLLSALLPCPAPNHATARNRTHRVAAEIEAKRPEAPEEQSPTTTEMVVVIDGAHVRAAPGHQDRHLDVAVGKVEVAGRRPRRFAFAPQGATSPLGALRAALVEQGWYAGRPLTVISDGEAALPNLVRAASSGGPVRHVLDWFHVAMRLRPIEQMLSGITTRHLFDSGPALAARSSINRARRLLWHGRLGPADEELIRCMNHSADITLRNGEGHRATTTDLRRLCADLRGYLGNNQDAIVNYHRRYCRARPVSTSRAEGCVDEICNARMGKRRRMRWSPRGAHRVAVIRAAFLDGRLGASTAERMAA